MKSQTLKRKKIKNFRKPKKGEFVCDCKAYNFPHRFSGGRCNGMFVVEETWEQNFGLTGECEHCNCINDTDHVPYCEVLSGGEPSRECPAWQEFVGYNEIKIYRKRKKCS